MRVICDCISYLKSMLSRIELQGLDAFIAE